MAARRSLARAGAQEKLDLSLSDLLAPSFRSRLERGPLNAEGWTIFKMKFVQDPPSEKYIAALRAEGKKAPERKPAPAPDPIDASGWGPETQILYVKLAIREGDWRSLKGTKPTPKMQDLFVRGRARYLAWKERHANDRVEILPDVEHEMIRRKEIIYPEIDTTRCCAAHGCKDCPVCPPKEKIA